MYCNIEVVLPFFQEFTLGEGKSGTKKKRGVKK